MVYTRNVKKTYHFRRFINNFDTLFVPFCLTLKLKGG